MVDLLEVGGKINFIFVVLELIIVSIICGY